MARTACVDLPAFPLQWLLRQHPDWQTFPAAVVDREGPHGTLVWVNELARRSGIAPGMRYRAGVSLHPELRGGVVPASVIETERDRLVRRLWRFTPGVEPSSTEAGVFWLDPSGLQALYPSLHEWAMAIRADLAGAGWHAAVAVGFLRLFVYAAARTGHAVRVFLSPQEERAHGRRTSLAHLGCSPALVATLCKLGLERLGAFVDLPAAEIHRRFGDEAHGLYRQARALSHEPLQPVRANPPLERTYEFEDPEENLEHIMSVARALLSSLMDQLQHRKQSLTLVKLRIDLDDGEVWHERLQPAEPTQDQAQVALLIQLRLGGQPWSARVRRLGLSVEGAVPLPVQAELFHAPPRDRRLAEDALARIRAQCGEWTVVRACLSSEHWPETSFRWEPWSRWAAPHPQDVSARPLVRRLYAVPRPLGAIPRLKEWRIDSHEGPVVGVHGPYLMSGQWWAREKERAYYYVRMQSGRWLWMYGDRRQGRWFLQGEVE